MKLNFIGEISTLKDGMEILTKDFDFELCREGVMIEVINQPGELKVVFDGNKGLIKYDQKIHFFRGLGLLLENLRKKSEFAERERPQFTMTGVMIDVSRNAVLRVETIKKILRLMAIMGLNMLMLYTEDTYQIDELPYFGYMRGRYSYQELKECDNYADTFGIEMIPCIQTLAHLQQALKWNYASEIRDTGDILLVGAEETYQFIDKMIKAATAPFKSKRIHIGMDEAHALGRGRYLERNGYQPSFDIINKHLGLVKEITAKYGLVPMIWSDMYFRLAAENQEYYQLDLDIPQDVIDHIPEEVQLVYWDYYHNDEGFYRDFIRKHQDFGKLPIFAGGIWTWAGITPNLNKTIVTTNAALKACKQEGIKEVFATMWGDNGGETNLFSALVGFQLFAEHSYSPDLKLERVKERFEFCTGGDYDAFIDLTNFDAIPEIAEENIVLQSNPAKFLLWQDPLLGLFDRHIEGMELFEHYSKLEARLKDYLSTEQHWGYLFKMFLNLATVLKHKCDLGLRMKQAYDQGDQVVISNLYQVELPELYTQVEKLRVAHREQWFATYKPFGWEIIDLRYGGLLARIKTTRARLENYLTGELAQIEELEAERLYFDGPERPADIKLGNYNQYNRIVSASPL